MPSSNFISDLHVLSCVEAVSGQRLNLATSTSQETARTPINLRTRSQVPLEVNPPKELLLEPISALPVLSGHLAHLLGV